MNKYIKYLIAYELILICLFGVGYLFYEAQQPKQVINTCNIVPNDEADSFNVSFLDELKQGSGIISENEKVK
jgi:hypothetical protein